MGSGDLKPGPYVCTSVTPSRVGGTDFFLLFLLICFLFFLISGLKEQGRNITGDLGEFLKTHCMITKELLPLGFFGFVLFLFWLNN